MEDLRNLSPYFRAYKRSLFAGVLCILASVIISLLIPLIVGRAIDDLLAEVSWGKIVRYVLMILWVSGMSGLFWFLQRRIMSGISRHIEYDMRREFYAHLQRQPLAFFQSTRTGDMMARATNDLSAVRELIGIGISYSLQTLFYIGLILPLMLRISVSLTALLFITMPLVSVTVKYFGQQIHVRFGRLQEFFAQISASAQESFTGVRVVRAYAQEEAEADRFDELNRLYAERAISLVRISAVMRPLMRFIIGAGFLIIIWHGGTLAARGEITLGQFTEFNLYLARLVWPLVAFGHVINFYQRGTASLKRIQSVLAITPAITDASGLSAQPPIDGRVEIRHLTFAYQKAREPVLYDINLEIEAGQTIAFVGRTGGGKSTLLSLIPRLLEAPPETIFIDGVCVRRYPLAQLRSAIGYVPQETFLFSDTLAENIAFGVDGAGRAQIEWAARIAGLTEDVLGFPQGLETLVGERGITLSGGQKQRAAIARAVIRQPKILLLDDSLSAVDTYTEEKILALLRGVMRDRTSLIVSQRISTVREADLICVLDDGRIIERGTHDELLAQGGEYAALYERQLLQEELAAS